MDDSAWDLKDAWGSAADWVRGGWKAFPDQEEAEAKVPRLDMVVLRVPN